MSLTSTGLESNQVPDFGNMSQQKLASDVGSSKIKKLMAESVEVAISLCHQYLHITGHTKLTDIVNQIIPTGWILSTGYWAYYSNQQGHCLCVCSRFGIPCRHVRSYDHWLDLSSTTDFLPDPTAINLPATASVTVTNFECNITAMGYELYNINTRFQVFVSEGGKVTETRQLWIDGNYKLCLERYASIELCIMFHPSPQSLSYYGKILNNVLINHGVQETFVTSNSSKQTFITFPLNTQHSYTTIAFPMIQVLSSNKTKMFDACTQTEGFNDTACSQQFQEYAHPLSSLVSTDLSLQTPSPSLYNQLPPPYPFPNPVRQEMLQYRERFDRRGRRGPRGYGNSGQGFGNVTLSMFMDNEHFNQPQPQAFRGRKSKKAARRTTLEPFLEPKAENVSMEVAPEDLANRMDAELSLVDTLLP